MTDERVNKQQKGKVSKSTDREGLAASYAAMQRCNPALSIVTGSDERAREVERVAKALGLHRQPGGKDSRNPPTRWPSGPQDTLSGRDGTVPLTWDFAEQCRADARVMLAASRPTEAGAGGQPISTAPYACHVLAGRFDEANGEWAFSVVSSPPIRPFTHWWPLPDLAAALATPKPPVDEEARRLIERLASADIDVSGTAAIGINSADIIAAGDWLARNLTGDGAGA